MHLAYLTDIEMMITPGCAEEFPLFFDDPGLTDCHYSDTGVTLPAVLDQGVTLIQPIHENALIVIVMEDDANGKAAFVIDVSDDDLKHIPDLHLCPVCGFSGPFDAFCPTQHALHKDGEFTALETGRTTFDDNVRTDCPRCEYWNERHAFQVRRWKPHELPETGAL